MKFDKQYTLRLAVGSSKIYERIFDASCYNPSTRNDVDVRELFSSFSKRLQKIFTKKSYNHQLNGYHLLNEYAKTVTRNLKPYSKLNIPAIDSVMIKSGSESFKISGVKLKLSLLINDGEKTNIIIERDCYVTKELYNGRARFSLELIEFFEELQSEIETSLREKDIEYIWSVNS